jgi:hypothetical protein
MMGQQIEGDSQHKRVERRPTVVAVSLVDGQARLDALGAEDERKKGTCMTGGAEKGSIPGRHHGERRRSRPTGDAEGKEKRDLQESQGVRPFAIRRHA